MGKEAGDLKMNQMKLRAEKLEGISQLEYDVEGKENTIERPHKRCWNEGWKMLKEQIWQKKKERRYFLESVSQSGISGRAMHEPRYYYLEYYNIFHLDNSY